MCVQIVFLLKTNNKWSNQGQYENKMNKKMCKKAMPYTSRLCRCC